jgi:hypothetical protein
METELPKREIEKTKRKKRAITRKPIRFKKPKIKPTEVSKIAEEEKPLKVFEVPWHKTKTKEKISEKIEDVIEEVEEEDEELRQFQIEDIKVDIKERANKVNIKLKNRWMDMVSKYADTVVDDFEKKFSYSKDALQEMFMLMQAFIHHMCLHTYYHMYRHEYLSIKDVKDTFYDSKEDVFQRAVSRLIDDPYGWFEVAESFYKNSDSWVEETNRLMHSAARYISGYAIERLSELPLDNRRIKKEALNIERSFVSKKIRELGFGLKEEMAYWQLD